MAMQEADKMNRKDIKKVKKDKELDLQKEREGKTTKATSLTEIEEINTGRTTNAASPKSQNEKALNYLTPRKPCKTDS